MSNETEPDSPGKKIIKASKKEAKQKETNMKISPEKKLVTKTVGITLAAVIVILGTLYAGFLLGTKYEAYLNDRIVTEASLLAEKSKTNQ